MRRLDCPSSPTVVRLLDLLIFLSHIIIVVVNIIIVICTYQFLAERI
ncbi:hypothetical protein HanXRQr2_Chr01g0016261 [Helianthus annuus]|uniref:Uncharacterized protein n=1 Tax=Helianthus annuus TaxID=4232 RepID=A0A9K3P1U9_HELAN|nr:hypothetical protein HanXRQr2_Chr01g0016261 [Helianthus annuus]KAJ0956506.1 hypothetical protein HanPSC8_Chr01g0015581 [Helianthus annuus]